MKIHFIQFSFHFCFFEEYFNFLIFNKNDRSTAMCNMHNEFFHDTARRLIDENGWNPRKIDQN